MGSAINTHPEENIWNIQGLQTCQAATCLPDW